MSFVLKRSFFVLAVIALVTAILVPHARNGTIDNRLEENVLTGTHLDSYNEFRKLFGDDRILIATFEFDALDHEILSGLMELEDAVMATGSADRVVSPVSFVREVLGIDSPEGLERWLAGEGGPEALEKRLGDFSSLRGVLVSRAGKKVKAGSLIVHLSRDVSDTDIKKIEALSSLISGHPCFRGRIEVTGIPDIVGAIHRYTLFSQKHFTPATMLIIAAVLLILFRGSFWFAAPIAAIALPLGWTLGIFNLAGNTNNFITSMIPPLLLGIGLTSSIHLITAYLSRTGGGAFDSETLSSTFRDLLPPIAMCQATTIMGFGSLAANGLGAIRSYGLYSALGVVMVLVSTYTVVPALAALTRPTGGIRFRWSGDSMGMGSCILWVGRFVVARPGLVVAASLAALAAGIVGMAKLGLETSLLRYLPAGHPVTERIRHTESLMSGIVPVHLVLRSLAGGASLADPAVCRAIAKLQADLTDLADVDSAISHVSLVQDYDRTFSGEPDNIPPSEEEVIEYLDFFRPPEEVFIDQEVIRSPDGSTLEIRFTERISDAVRPMGLVGTFLTPDYRTGQITMRIRDVSSKRLSGIFDAAEQLAGRRLAGLADFHLTGRAFLWAQASETLVRNEVENFFLSLAMIDLVIMLFFGSVSIGIMALLPNLLPLVILYGFMGFSGLTVNTVTGMIACVAIGMSVDDTIHLIHEVRRRCRAGEDHEPAILGALEAKGSAMVFTTVVIVAGFLVLTVSDFVPTFQFGALISATFAMALGLDLTLTPALLMLLKPFSGGK